MDQKQHEIAPSGGIGDRFGAPTFYGEKGVMKEINGKVLCHICGKTFHHLGGHVAMTHELTADEYCDEFGLNRSTGLISDVLAQKRRLVWNRQLQDPEFLAKLSPRLFKKGEIFPSPTTRPKSLQAKLHPQCAKRIKRLAKYAASTRLPPKLRHCVICETLFTEKQTGRVTKVCSRPCLRVYRSKHMKGLLAKDQAE